MHLCSIELLDSFSFLMTYLLWNQGNVVIALESGNILSSLTFTNSLSRIGLFSYLSMCYNYIVNSIISILLSSFSLFKIHIFSLMSFGSLCVLRYLSILSKMSHLLGSISPKFSYIIFTFEGSAIFLAFTTIYTDILNILFILIS